MILSLSKQMPWQQQTPALLHNHEHIPRRITDGWQWRSSQSDWSSESDVDKTSARCTRCGCLIDQPVARGRKIHRPGIRRQYAANNLPTAHTRIPVVKSPWGSPAAGMPGFRDEDDDTRTESAGSTAVGCGQVAAVVLLLLSLVEGALLLSALMRCHQTSEADVGRARCLPAAT